jgi:hypothetical protein
MEKAGSADLRPLKDQKTGKEGISEAKGGDAGETHTEYARENVFLHVNHLSLMKDSAIAPNLRALGWKDAEFENGRSDKLVWPGGRFECALVAAFGISSLNWRAGLGL